MSLIKEVYIDDEMLLAGHPIELPNICAIYPPTIREITKNLQVYQENVYAIVGDLKELQKIPSEVDISNFELIIVFCSKNEEFRARFTRALEFFTHQEVVVLPEIFAVQIGPPRLRENLLTRDSFPQLQRIVKAVCRQGEYNLEDNENEKVKELLEKFKTRREVLAKKHQDDQLDLSTMASCLALRYQDIDKVLDMTYYTFLDQFIRMGYEEDYNTNLRSALAGAKVPKDKMKYWVRPIQKE